VHGKNEIENLSVNNMQFLPESRNYI
jgi:hypothetical protein